MIASEACFLIEICWRFLETDSEMEGRVQEAWQVVIFRSLPVEGKGRKQNWVEQEAGLQNNFRRPCRELCKWDSPSNLSRVHTRWLGACKCLTKQLNSGNSNCWQLVIHMDFFFHEESRKLLEIIVRQWSSKFSVSQIYI